MRNSHQTHPRLPLRGRAPHGNREWHLAKERFGSNRARQERLQSPAATTTEPNPLRSVRAQVFTVNHEQKGRNHRTLPLRSHRDGNRLGLTKLLQERSHRPGARTAKSEWRLTPSVAGQSSAGGSRGSRVRQKAQRCEDIGRRLPVQHRGEKEQRGSYLFSSLANGSINCS